MKLTKCHCFKGIDTNKIQKYYVSSMHPVKELLLECSKHYGFMGYKNGYMVFNTTWKALSGLSEYCGDMTGYCFEFYMESL